MAATAPQLNPEPMINERYESKVQKVISIAQKALELDPQLANAHVLLADGFRKQWKWTEAEAEYKRALELSPNSGGSESPSKGHLVERA
jgi:tetratricopeptide (TPR) repeat protein